MLTFDRITDVAGNSAQAEHQCSNLRQGLLFGFALFAGLSAFTSFDAAFAGSIPATGRVLVGLLGFTAAGLLWAHARFGWQLAFLWALLQVPVIAWSPEGSPTPQLFTFFLAVTDQQQVNGQLVAFSQFGINLVGVLFAVLFHHWRSLFEG